MLAGNCYSGDNNDTLKRIQFGYCEGSIRSLVSYCWNRYRAAVLLTGVPTDLSRRFAKTQTFDRRVLQAAHDRIAAYYRFAFDRCQIPLPFDDLPYEDYLTRGWLRFFSEEAQRLAECDEIMPAVLTAIAYQRTPTGYEAERRLMELLDDRYGPLCAETFDETSD